MIFDTRGRRKVNIFQMSEFSVKNNIFSVVYTGANEYQKIQSRQKYQPSNDFHFHYDYLRFEYDYFHFTKFATLF